MKKVLLYLFSVLLLGSALSSCLGDSGSSFESTGYGVVDVKDNTKVLTFVISNQVYWLSATNLSAYNKGDIAKADFKINLDNKSTIYQADYINIVDQNVYTVAEQQDVNVDSVPAALNAYKIKTFSVNMPIISDYQLNRSLFSYSYSRKPGETVNGLVFYYDANNQTDAATSTNTYIVDVRLDVQGFATGTETTTESGSTGVDFSMFKQLIAPDTSTIPESGSYSNIWFRYYAETSSTTSTTVTLLKTTGTQFYYSK